MGLFDAPAPSLRGIAPNPFGSLRMKLDRGGENATIGVVGDSTGNCNTDPRWPRQFANSLAAAYPGYTVNLRPWNEINNNYDTTVVVQAGNGGRAVTDGATTSGSAILSSATLAPTIADVGRGISGAGIPVSTTILSIPQTSVTVGSNGASLPQATINAVTTGFPSAGSFLIATGTGPTAVVSYTGTTGTAFTGCTVVSGATTGTLATGNVILSTTAVTMSANATATAAGVTTTLAARLIDIYNGSASGKNPNYSQQWTINAFPVNLDLLFVNHGHNMGLVADSTTIRDYYQLVRDVLRYISPNVPVVCFAQNPEVGASYVGSGAHLLRATRLAELCASEGWHFINVMQAFLDNPTWATDWMSADGVHPNVAGDVVWGTAIWQVWQQAKAYGLPLASRVQPDRILVPAGHLIPALIVGGSPAAAVLSNFLPVMGYSKQASSIGASFLAHVPSSWRLINAWVWWTNTDGAAGNVAWSMDITAFARNSQDMVSGVGTTALAAGAGGVVTGVSPTTVLAESHTLILSGSNISINASPPHGIRSVLVRLTRQCANGGDTYAGTAQVYGVVLERAA